MDGNDDYLRAELNCILARMALVAAEIWALSSVRKGKGRRSFSWPGAPEAGVAEELRRLAWRVEDYYGENEGAEPIPPSVAQVREFKPLYSRFVMEHGPFVEERVRTILDALLAGERVA